jgi:dienelactone hydrolase
MRLTVTLAAFSLVVLLGACGGSSEQSASPVATTTGGSTSTAPPPLAECAELLSYDDSAPLELKVRGTANQGGVEVDDVLFTAAGRRIAAYLVRPQEKPQAAVLWAHWYGEEANTDRTEFLPDATALAQEGVVSLLPQGTFPWREPVSDVAAEDRKLTIDQVVQLRRGLDVLEQEAGDVPIGFVGHDYGAMFGILLVADKRPQAYVLMAPDATFSNWFIKYFVRSASKTEFGEAFAPLDPASNVGDAAPASLVFQFAETDPYVPGYIAERLFDAASEPKETRSYGGGHELDKEARRDRLAWLRRELDLTV